MIQGIKTTFASVAVVGASYLFFTGSAPDYQACNDKLEAGTACTVEETRSYGVNQGAIAAGAVGALTLVLGAGTIITSGSASGAAALRRRRH